FVGLYLAFHERSWATVTSLDFAFSVAVVLPFAGGIVYGGRWLAASDLPVERYPRIAKWLVGGMAGYFLLNLGMMLAWPLESTYGNVAWVEYCAYVGAGGGLAVGLFEARGIQRAVLAERHRVERENAERRSERLEEFADVVAHDIRNPLNVAEGHLELLRADTDSEHVEAVADAHERMHDIVDRTLTLARSGRVISETEPAALGDVARASWQTVATDRASLVVESPPTVSGDPDRLAHLFENLFRNAVDHGGDAVTVTVGALPDGFYVADDGPGIPEADREAVLEPGYSSEEDGSGLGLAIVTQIVDAHGWTLTVTESEDGGARFEITGVEQGGD
ncbi:MAG: sensor histidine kinase, partial [Halobacterium sp.]